MRRVRHRYVKAVLLVLAVLLLVVGPAGSALAAITINGAGATFPYPLYSRWAAEYKARTGVKVNYQPIGSGGGIAAIKAGTVLFGGTDAPLTKSELDRFKLVQFPTCVGGVVPIVNLAGVGNGKLRLTGPVLAKIFLGEIKRWNDPAIKALNPGLSLPSSSIYVVHRSDASGTTWIFTHYLSAVSSTWRSKVGADKSVKWPVGIGGKGNEGVTALVKAAKGRIGYVEYAYALQSRVPYVQLKNKAGYWVQPSLATFAAAASNATWSAKNGFYTIFVNAPGAKSWPIAGASFVLTRRSTSDYTTARAMYKFWYWCYTNSTARSIAAKLHYVSMPSSVVKAVTTVWKTQVTAGGKPVWP